MKFLAGLITGALGMMLLYAAYGIDITDLGKTKPEEALPADTVYMADTVYIYEETDSPKANPATGTSNQLQTEKELRRMNTLIEQLRKDMQQVKDAVGRPATSSQTTAPTATQTQRKTRSETKEQDLDRSQRFEIKSRKGTVTLYMGMDKESVEQLMGKPDAVSVLPMGGVTHENWTYDRDYKKDIPRSSIMFENGRLTSITQI